jgi:hypothetical protein
MIQTGHAIYPTGRPHEIFHRTHCFQENVHGKVKQRDSGRITDSSRRSTIDYSNRPYVTPYTTSRVIFITEYTIFEKIRFEKVK